MQLTSRPFREADVFRVAHAYEKATAWRDARPNLDQLTKAPPIKQVAVSHDVETDEGSNDRAQDLVERLGLKLSEPDAARLYEAAPYIFSMAERVRKRRDRFDEPANIFVAGGYRRG